MDWKAKSPNQYAMYFKCTSKLVLTFKEVFGDLFNYETTRAIVFRLDDHVPAKELKECIKAALTYHSVKDLPHLGMKYIQSNRFTKGKKERWVAENAGQAKA